MNEMKFRNEVLKWVYSMQTGPTSFRMNEGADSTIFTVCFALFIFDLFGEVGAWMQKDRRIWADYINSFQDKDSGYFIPDNYSGKLNSKPLQQLTTFCLDALDMLGESPRYDPFIALNQWPTSEDVADYLKKIGCFKGYPTTGNMAMFLGIFLTRKYLRDGDKTDKDLLETWFNAHEKTQNKSTGFWGNSLSNRYYHGFQNAFHQFVIYNYWDRAIPLYTKIVDIVLSLQDEDGHFGPIPGGGGCWDYDATDILINCGYKKGYREKDVELALTRLFFAILKNQNNDGGFCESKARPSNPIEVFGYLNFIFSDHNLYLTYYRLRATLNVARRGKRMIETHWTRKGREWGQSDLWDTWFRCLTLAEITESIDFDNPLKHLNWKFHKLIGLGFFKT